MKNIYECEKSRVGARYIIHLRMLLNTTSVHGIHVGWNTKGSTGSSHTGISSRIEI